MCLAVGLGQQTGQTWALPQTGPHSVSPGHPGLHPAHRLLFFTFLSSRLFKALSSAQFHGICWVSQNPLGSTGPSSGQRGAFEGCTSLRMPLKPSSQSQLPMPFPCRGSVLVASLLADGWYPPGVKMGGAAGLGEGGVFGWL